MSFDGYALTEWASVEGEPRHVSDFAHLDPKDRPGAVCLDCKGSLIFKCGSEKIHHFAHRDANECTGRGEGIEHYNSKLHLAKILKQVDVLTALNRCRNCNGLTADEITVEFDEVQVEHGYGNGMRADIGLLKNGNLCCVVEIFVSHHCELPKIIFHKNSNIPCIELSADIASKWTPTKKLAASAIYGSQMFICYMCESRQIEAIKSQKSLYEPSNESLMNLTGLSRLFRSQNTKKIIGWRNVWLQAGINYKHKFLVEVFETTGNNPKKYLQVTGEFSEPNILCQVSPPYTSMQKHLFNKRYNEFIEILKDLNYEVFQSAWKTSID